MKKEIILKKAIEKAGLSEDYMKFKKEWDWFKKQSPMLYRFVMRGFVFSHDFAKAFWGEKEVILDDDQEIDNSKLGRELVEYVPGWHKCLAWQYHLQQMVLEPDPLKYLEKFLNETNPKM